MVLETIAVQVAHCYRKSYTARHTSVSWNLMIGKNPLQVKSISEPWSFSQQAVKIEHLHVNPGVEFQ